MRHFSMVVDRMALIDFLTNAAADTLNVDSGSVIEFGFGDVLIHFVVIDESEESSDD